MAETMRSSGEIKTTLPRIILEDSVVEATIDDEVLLLNVDTGTYFGLDAIGTRIWELLSRGVTTESLVERLFAEYDVDPARLLLDVRNFLHLLIAHGLAREEQG